MQVQVIREACCSQDDQMGPLEATYSIASNATLGELVAIIVASEFFQYSSSHIILQGAIDGRAAVSVFSAFYCANKEPEFLVSPSQLAVTVVGASPFRFRFVFP